MRDFADTGRALASSSLVAFVGVCDPDRAKRFYRDTLGLHLVSEELPFALVFDVQGTMLRVTVVPEVKPAKFTVLGWKVPDIQAAVSSLDKEGVEFQRYAGLQQDGLGIWTSPSGARVAWFHDPDGNILSVTQL
ncbi:MAG: VOC family protein [Acidobacteriota bacterium]|nr:VOC family protein [Acidobacteriota bacterium]